MVMMVVLLSFLYSQLPFLLAAMQVWDENAEAAAAKKEQQELEGAGPPLPSLA